MIYDYNTTRAPMMLREYGRNIQKMMDQIIAIKDKALRTQKAYSLVKLIEIMSNKSEVSAQRWDELFILSNYQLAIDSPYPMPARKDINKHIFQSDYKLVPIKYKYYGRNIELLVCKAAALTCQQEQEKMVIIIINLMYRFSQLWNNECISFDRIIADIQRIAPHKIAIDVAKLQALPGLMMNNTASRYTRHSKTTTTTATFATKNKGVE